MAQHQETLYVLYGLYLYQTECSEKNEKFSS